MKKYIIVIVLVLLAGAFFWQERKSASGREISVRLKWLHNGEFAGMYIAQEKGWYKKDNLKVTFKERDFSSGSISEEVASGKVDVAVVSATSLLKAVSEGASIKALAAVYQMSPAILGAKAESGITKPSDLKGKILGIVADDLQSRIYFNSLMKLYNVPLDSVSYKVVGFKQAESVNNGEVDVAPWFRLGDAYELEQAGTRFSYIQPEDFGLNMYDDVIIASDSFIKNNPRELKSFISATLRGWEYALANKEEAVKATMRYASGKYANKNLENEILRKSLPLIEPNSSTKVGDMDYWRWRKMYDVLKTNSNLKPFDVTNAYTSEFLK